MLMCVRLAPSPQNQSHPSAQAGLYLLQLAQDIAQTCPAATITVRYGRLEHEQMDITPANDGGIELF